MTATQKDKLFLFGSFCVCLFGIGFVLGGLFYMALM